MQFDPVKYAENLPKKARDGAMDVLLQVNDDPNWTDARQLTYFMATVQWETAHTYKPLREWNRGRGTKYGYWFKGYVWYGRGLVQITWYKNYANADNHLKLNGALVNNADLALDPEISYQIASRGMREGWFTHKKLSDFINASKCDYLGARAVINGKDKQREIGILALKIEDWLQDAQLS